MKELDYYTIMEKRITYYAKKYDPHDRYGPKSLNSGSLKKPVRKEKVHRKLTAEINYLISLFF